MLAGGLLPLATQGGGLDFPTPSPPWQHRWDDPASQTETARFLADLLHLLDAAKDDPATLLAAPVWQHDAEAATTAADLQDVAQACREAGRSEAGTTRLTAAYAALRQAMRAAALPRLEPDDHPGDTLAPAIVHLMPPMTPGRTIDAYARPFDLSAHGDLLDALPREFGLYLQGVAFYDFGRYEEASAAWQALLLLPPAERRFRSTWARYMIGRLHLAARSESQAWQDFEGLARLADDGFVDSLQLAASGRGWQGRMARRDGQWHDAIASYIDQCRRGRGYEQLSAINSLTLLAHRVVTDLAPPGNAAAAEVLRDPLQRLVVLLCATRNEPHCPFLTRHAHDLLGALQGSGEPTPTVGADVMAGLAYRAGDLDGARVWLSYADPASPNTLWLRSRFSLRAGNQEAARRLLLAATAPATLSRLHDAPRVLGDLGRLQLDLEQRDAALETYLHAGLWLDAAHVAERVMTADELAAFIASHAKDPLIDRPLVPTIRRPGFPDAEPASARLRHLLGRRLVRDGDLERARTYLPPSAAEAVVSLQRQNAILAQADAGKAAWAAAHFSIANTLAASGMALRGTELAPDWGVFDGDYDPAKALTYRLDQGAPAAERQRVAASAPAIDEPLHYRVIAADHYWECADLLPDDHPFTARALYQGGTLLASAPRSPRAAERFLKALITRCSALVVGRDAAQQRGFPKAFDARRVADLPAGNALPGDAAAPAVEEEEP